MQHVIPKRSLASIAGLVATGALTLIGSSGAAAQSSQSADAARQSSRSAMESPARPETQYTWSAQLVAFDAASNTLTARAMLVPDPEKNDLAALRAGDDAVLTWSGISSGVGVRAIERGSASSFDRMTMPVEFVGSELDGRYVSFKVPIPSSDAAALAQLGAGAYVTATSPMRARSANESVISIRPYNADSARASAAGGS